VGADVDSQADTGTGVMKLAKEMQTKLSTNTPKTSWKHP
jgi:hypothetical protein